MKPIYKYFNKLRKFIQLNKEKRQLYLFKPNNTFVRKSPLSFQRTVILIGNLLRQTLAVELARFFQWKHKNIVTKSAFCQRRQAIKSQFFTDLFEQTHRQFYPCFPNIIAGRVSA